MPSLRAVSIPLARRFRLLEPIGEGGSGAVWAAWDRQARCVVAVKIVPSYDVPLPFPAEHPHLALPDDLLTDGVVTAVSMRLVRGGTADHA